jgi:Ca2+-binding RTX toxin-like protein
MPRLLLLAPSFALLIALLLPSPTLAVLLIGTKNGDTLTGTTGNDHITGAEGDDTLRGKAGNDTYFFADTWGSDTFIEKPGEGTDTLNFRGVRSGPITVYLVR